jgi:phosphate transport system substrate-binding protein
MKSLLPICMAWFCTLLVCFPPHVQGASEQKGKLIRVRGSNAMATLADNWAKEFQEATGISVAISGGGTDAGFDALFDKSADLVMASRKIRVKEMQAAALSDTKPAEEEICHGALTIITHPANPLKELTLEQLRKLFTGEITSWSEVGGPVEQVTLIVSQPTSGAAEFIRERVLGNDYFSSEARIRDYYHHSIKELSRKTPPALSYVPYLDAVRAEQLNLLKILGIKKDNASAAVFPSIATMRDGSYPFVLPLYFYWNSTTASPVIKQFVDFCKTRCTTRGGERTDRASKLLAVIQGLGERKRVGIFQ